MTPPIPADHRHSAYRWRITGTWGPEECPKYQPWRALAPAGAIGALEESGRPQCTVYAQTTGSNPVRPAILGPHVPLGATVPCKHRAGGSTPLGSTSFPANARPSTRRSGSRSHRQIGKAATPSKWNIRVRDPVGLPPSARSPIWKRPSPEARSSGDSNSPVRTNAEADGDGGPHLAVTQDWGNPAQEVQILSSAPLAQANDACLTVAN